MLKLEQRPQASKFWTYGSPILALLITVLVGVCLFALLGKDPVKGLQAFFWEPIKSGYALGELAVKATPLLLIALGLAVCFRSNVWNIGAEGQFVIGAVAAGGIALLADKTTGPWIVPAILIAGMLGGHSRLAARPLQRQRNPGQPDAGLCGHAGAGLSGLWSLEGPHGLQLPADQEL
ncbi:hypothetical protein Cthiooxydans_36670 [Comamonas thiooxydans]|nr:hypothetical protein Cthiooxydans_36670 [Comamonas thiooxydans]